MKIPNYIYAYIEPRPRHPKFRLVRYTGKGETEKRLLDFKAHNHGDVGPWIEELITEGYRPGYQILEVTKLTGEKIFKLEEDWTNLYRSIGQSDLNVATHWPPNTAGKPLSPERRQQISSIGTQRTSPKKGKSLHEGIRIKMSVSHQNPSENICNKISIANSGENNGSAKLSKREALEIRDLTKIRFFTINKIAEMYGVSKPAIDRIKAKKAWKNASWDKPTESYFSRELILEVKDQLKKHIYTRIELSKKYGLSKSTLIKIVNGKLWGDVK